MLSMEPWPSCPPPPPPPEASFFLFFFAQRRPHALQSVLGPLGPLRHSGILMYLDYCQLNCQDWLDLKRYSPQSVQTYSSATLSFFFFSPVRGSRSMGIAIPASPLI